MPFRLMEHKSLQSLKGYFTKRGRHIDKGWQCRHKPQEYLKVFSFGVCPFGQKDFVVCLHTRVDTEKGADIRPFHLVAEFMCLTDALQLGHTLHKRGVDGVVELDEMREGLVGLRVGILASGNG